MKTRRASGRHASKTFSSQTTRAMASKARKSISREPRLIIAATGDTASPFGYQSTRFYLLCVWLPFFYGAATRVPMIYIGLHSHGTLQYSWTQTGLVLGGYQLSRALANFAIPKLGAARSHGFSTRRLSIRFVLNGGRFFELDTHLSWIMNGYFTALSPLQVPPWEPLALVSKYGSVTGQCCFCCPSCS